MKAYNGQDGKPDLRPHCAYYDKHNVTDQTRILFTTLHSLHKYTGSGKFLDTDRARRMSLLFVFDEVCTALYTDYQSPDVIRPLEVERSLGRVLYRLANHVVLIDANLSALVVANVLKRIPQTARRVHDYHGLHKFQIHSFHSLYNPIVQQKRTAHVFTSPVSARTDLLAIVSRDILDNGGRVAIFHAGRVELENAEEMLREYTKDSIDTSQIYTCTSKKRPPKHLVRDMLAKNPRIFLYTTAAGNGVDLSFLDEDDADVEFFQAVVLMGVAREYLSLLDVYQASGRVRCCRDLYVELDESPMSPFALVSFSGWRDVFIDGSMDTFIRRLSSPTHSDERARGALSTARGELADYHEEFQDIHQFHARRLELCMNLLIQDRDDREEARGVLGRLRQLLFHAAPDTVPADNDVYAETLAIGWLHRVILPFRATCMVSFLGEIGYKTVLHRKRESEPEVFREFRNLQERADVKRQLPRDLGEDTVSPQELAGAMSKVGLVRRLGDDMMPSKTRHKIVDLAKHRPNVFKILTVYHRLGLSRPRTLQQWERTLHAIMRTILPPPRVRSSNMYVLESTRFIVDSISLESGSFIQGVSLYAAALLAGLDGGFFAPRTVVEGAMEDEASADEDDEAMEEDEFFIDIDALCKGQLRLASLEQIAAFIDGETAKNGSALFVAKKNRKGTKDTRHLMRLGRALLCTSLGYRGAITATKKDEVGIVFGLYVRFACDTPNFGIAREELDAVAERWDGLALVSDDIDASRQALDDGTSTRADEAVLVRAGDAQFLAMKKRRVAKGNAASVEPDVEDMRDDDNGQPSSDDDDGPPPLLPEDDDTTTRGRSRQRASRPFNGGLANVDGASCFVNCVLQLFLRVESPFLDAIRSSNADDMSFDGLLRRLCGSFMGAPDIECLQEIVRHLREDMANGVIQEEDACEAIQSLKALCSAPLQEEWNVVYSFVRSSYLTCEACHTEWLGAGDMHVREFMINCPIDATLGEGRTLADHLSRFLGIRGAAPEREPIEVLCSNCSSNRAWHASVLSGGNHLPPFLLVALKRTGFTNGAPSRINTAVKASMLLDLAPHLDSECSVWSTYSLCGILCHEEGVIGHWTAAIREGATDVFTMYSDLRVERGQTWDELDADTRGVLFLYRRCDDNQLSMHGTSRNHAGHGDRHTETRFIRSKFV